MYSPVWLILVISILSRKCERLKTLKTWLLNLPTIIQWYAYLPSDIHDESDASSIWQESIRVVSTYIQSTATLH